MATDKITVRGAGIFGLSIAWVLTQRGAQVQLTSVLAFIPTCELTALLTCILAVVLTLTLTFVLIFTLILILASVLTFILAFLLTGRYSY